MRFPLVPGQEAERATYCDGVFGPTFGDEDITIVSAASTPDDVFDDSCYGKVGVTYQDILSQGLLTFTGTDFFTPVEVEVYLVL